MTTAAKPRQLTPKQARFVAEYAKDHNGTQAAIRAGYSENTAYAIASENLRKPEIVAALQAANESATAVVQAAQAEAVASEAWIVERAVEVVHRSLEHSPVYVGQGKNRRVLEGVFEYDGRTVVGALGLLAKRIPAFKDSVTIDQSQHLNLSGLTQEQLDAAIERLGSR